MLLILEEFILDDLMIEDLMLDFLMSDYAPIFCILSVRFTTILCFYKFPKNKPDLV